MCYFFQFLLLKSTLLAISLTGSKGRKISRLNKIESNIA